MNYMRAVKLRVEFFLIRKRFFFRPDFVQSTYSVIVILLIYVFTWLYLILWWIDCLYDASNHNNVSFMGWTVKNKMMKLHTFWSRHLFSPDVMLRIINSVSMWEYEGQARTVTQSLIHSAIESRIIDKKNSFVNL